MKNSHLLAALAAISFGAPLVAATSGFDAQRAVVSTAGLDLATPKGAKLLDLRITHAASSMCGTPSPSDAFGWNKFKHCRDAARIAVAEQRQIAIASANKRLEEAAVSAR